MRRHLLPLTVMLSIAVSLTACDVGDPAPPDGAPDSSSPPAPASAPSPTTSPTLSEEEARALAAEKDLADIGDTPTATQSGGSSQDDGPTPTPLPSDDEVCALVGTDPDGPDVDGDGVTDGLLALDATSDIGHLVCASSTGTVSAQKSGLVEDAYGQDIDGDGDDELFLGGFAAAFGGHVMYAWDGTGMAVVDGDDQFDLTAGLLREEVDDEGVARRAELRTWGCGDVDGDGVDGIVVEVSLLRDDGRYDVTAREYRYEGTEASFVAEVTDVHEVDDEELGPGTIVGPC